MSSALATSRSARRGLAALLLVIASFVFAACGGGSDSAEQPSPAPASVEEPTEPAAPETVAEAPVESADEGTVPAGAALAPANAPVFVALNGDLDSAQWLAVRDLLARIPGGQKVWDEAVADLAEEGIDLEADLKPALGPEVNVIFLDLPLTSGALEGCLAEASSGDLGGVAECGDGGAVDDPKVVLLTNPADPAKTTALIAKAAASSDDPASAPRSRVVDGWVMLAETEAILDEAQAGVAAGTLADSERFQTAMKALPADAALKLFVNGSLVQDLVDQAGQGNPQAAAIFAQLQGLSGTTEWVGVAARAEAGGLRVVGAAKSEGATLPEPYTAELPGVAPDGTLAYVSFKDLRTSIEQVLNVLSATQPELDQQLGQAEAFLGLNLEQDFLPLLEGEHALYVRPGLPIPEITLLLSPPDPIAAVATVDKVLGTVNALRGADDSTFSSGQEQIGGVTARKLTFPQGFAIYYAAVGDNLVITSAVSGIADLQAGGRLADSQDFKDALAAGGVPEQTNGFLVVDIDQIGALLDALPPDAADAQARQVLAALGDIVGYSTIDGDGVARFSAFVAVDGG